MDTQSQEFAREEIKYGLRQLPCSNVLLFMRMYSHKNLDASIDDAVDRVPGSKLEYALSQVRRTLESNN